MPAPKFLPLIALCMSTANVPLAAQDTAQPDPAPWRATKTSLYLAFTSARRNLPSATAALDLARKASVAALEGRPAEAEVLAERSLARLKQVAPAGPLWLEPLQTLAATQLDQKKIGRARETVRRIRDELDTRVTALTSELLATNS